MPLDLVAKKVEDAAPEQVKEPDGERHLQTEEVGHADDREVDEHNQTYAATEQVELIEVGLYLRKKK